MEALIVTLVGALIFLALMPLVRCPSGPSGRKTWTRY
jgi:hypothetical protein